MRRTAVLLAFVAPVLIVPTYAPSAQAEAGGSIEGQWFHDRNGDQIRQPEEPGFVGSLDVKILMDTWVATAHTGDDGRFRVDGLEPGDYRVIPKVGTIHGPTSPIERQVTVTEGDVVRADFATESGQISGVAWDDLNGDGQRQPDEPPKEGVLVRLNHHDSPELRTGPDGGYRFYDLNMTGYDVVFELLDGTTFSPPQVGEFDTDSNVIDFDEGLAPVVITPGKPDGVNHAVHVDAGYVPHP